MREFEALSALKSNQHNDDVENDGDGGDDDKDDGGDYGNEISEYREQTSCPLVYLDCSTVGATNKEEEVADI